MRGWRVFFQLHNQLAGDLNSQLAGGSFDVRPSHFGVGAEGLAFDEGDLTMPQLKQVLEGKLGGSLMVQDDVGHALYVVVAHTVTTGTERERFHGVSTAIRPSMDRSRKSLGYSSMRSGRWRWLATK